ncbi:transcriptional regulator [Salmonella enterica]|nr:transcriptional regulator [Salmonella enterica]ECF8135094.1 transcriptional regulator [Salmonella enterica]
MSWRYSISPKNLKTILRPRNHWLCSGSRPNSGPLLIWLYPQ